MLKVKERHRELKCTSFKLIQDLDMVFSNSILVLCLDYCSFLWNLLSGLRLIDSKNSVVAGWITLCLCVCDDQSVCPLQMRSKAFKYLMPWIKLMANVKMTWCMLMHAKHMLRIWSNRQARLSTTNDIKKKRHKRRSNECAFIRVMKCILWYLTWIPSFLE